MRANICYLLGAGASCETLPIASELGEGLEKALANYIQDIENLKFRDGLDSEETRLWSERLYTKKFLEDFKWLADYAKKHATVDTLARKLWIRRDERAKIDLLRLKAILSCFFLYEQSRLFPDKRYDSFFASILERGGPGEPRFPDNISIISWNYDLSLEKSYYEFCANQEIVRDHITNNSKIVRLNGIAGYVIPVIAGVEHIEYGSYQKLIHEQMEISVVHIIGLYERFFTEDKKALLKPEIHFAWENTDAVKKASDAISKSEILVVIGYSFPFFNQSIDRAFLSSAKSLQHIYLQNKGDYASKERIQNIMEDIKNPVVYPWSDHIEQLKATDYFHIPNEFIRK